MVAVTTSYGRFMVTGYLTTHAAACRIRSVANESPNSAMRTLDGSVCSRKDTKSANFAAWPPSN